ncbi:substrate-binding domain-containing protein [Renibacterium salmoninarum]|nr:substrate-binding domain-containing protein [Renibacterium salmoninarum]
MLTKDRQNQILHELAIHGSLNAADFARKVGTSAMTVRRDLALLDEQGLLQRVHGGAVVNAERKITAETRVAARVRPVVTIGMVVPTTRYYFPGIIRGAEAAAQELGVRLVLGVSNYSESEEQRHIQRLLSSKVDGLLVTPSGESWADTETLARLVTANVPVVVVERSIDDVLDAGQLESVRSDHSQGAEIAVTHLLSLGHTKIALCLRESSPTASAITAGYRRALRKVSLRPQAELSTMTQDVTDPEAQQRQMTETLDGFIGAGATAAIVHNDEDALMFADLCESRGLRVPDDLALLAYDD